MKEAAVFAQITISITVIALILLQNQGSGLGTTFGAGGEFYRSKRGLEKILFRATVLFAVLFFAISLLSFSLS